VIANKIWQEGKNHNKMLVKDNHPIIPMSLKFLFALYGCLENKTLLMTLVGIGAWIQGKISSTKYRFFFF
jgi:hypothetical protein